MTQIPPTQPLTRRERRLMEQGESGVSAVPTAPSEPILPSAPVEPPAPISRRERRLMEQGEAPVAPVVPAEVVVPTPPQAVEAPAVLPPVFASPAPPNTGATPVSGGVPVISASRVVGDFSTATSSLIIPETPTINFAGPLGDTGEIVVTGQIRLPSMMSERGTLPVLADQRDDDDVMDAYVTGAIPASAKPVRASQAVSGKGDDSDIVLVRRARWGTAAVVTSLGAAVLGLAAVALLILALMTDVLG